MPQSNRQHPVPQNIMDVEFKLIGELTMRQFSYLMVFGLAAYISFNRIPGLFRIPATLFFGLLALGLAFVPVGERGLDEWIVNFFKSINSPTQRKWFKEPQLPTAFLYDSLAIVQHEMITLAPTSSRRKLEEYLKFKSYEIDEDPLDIPEKSYVMKLKQVYQDAYPSGPAPSVGVLVDEPEVLVAPDVPDVPEFHDDKSTTTDSEKTDIGQVSTTPVSDYKEPSMVERTSEAITEEKIKTEAPEAAPERPASPVLRKSKFVDSGVDRRKIKRKSASSKTSVRSTPQPQSGLDMYSYSSITPDMHSGRKFTNLVPSEGEIILPIRGERVLRTSEELSIEDDIQEKARKLEELLQKISQEEGVDIKKPSPEKPATDHVDKEAEEMADKLKKQNEELNLEIERLKEQIQKGKSSSAEIKEQEDRLKKLVSQKGDIVSSYSELRKQVHDLQEKLDEKVKVSTGEEFLNKVRKQVPVLTDKVNVLTGVVRDAEGKNLGDMLLIVKNSRGDTIRALKTNSLGQFVVSTPLQNGTYTVEVSPVNKTNLTFAIIPIEAKGEVIPTLDVVGR
jgi:hypothetical protein